MGKQVLSNAFILAGEELEITRGYLVIDDSVIDEISEGSPPRRAINLNGGFIVPPFVNAHTHVVDSVAKELYLGKTQPQVVGLGGEKFRALELSSQKSMISATKVTLRDMIRTGTLAHCDFREGGVTGLNLLRKASSTPLISIVLGRFSKMKELSKILARANGIGLPRIDAFPQKEMKKISKQTLRKNKLFSVHVAETADDEKAFNEKFGKSEVEQAIDLKCSFVVHATHSDKEDLSKLKLNRTPVVFCPKSNSLLGAGVPPIEIALEMGNEFFFGTDNAMLCQPNMFEELSFAWACLRRVNTSAGTEEARAVLKAATIGPLELFKLPWSPIVEGKSATFMVLSRRNNLLNISNVYAGLINRARADNIKTIYLDGKIIIS